MNELDLMLDKIQRGDAVIDNAEPSESLPPHFEKLVEEYSYPYDTIHMPAHYNLTRPAKDCWDVMEQMGIIKNHFVASAFQYLWRCQTKNQFLSDLKKARAYLDKAIEVYEQQHKSNDQ